MSPAQNRFKGPGEWRSQADGAQRPDNPFAHLAEVQRRLIDAGLNTQATTVAEAIRALRAGDRDTAVAKLQAAARQLPAAGAHFAAGLHELAQDLPTQGTGGSTDPEPQDLDALD
jgi:hypothetical protein